MPRASDVDIHPGQRPDEDPSLAVRNNGGTPPSAEPAPPGRREALLVLSFGGPEGPDDVLPFLENVTRGRGIPRERLAEVAEHYHHFGGVSLINDQNKALIAAVEKDLAAAGIDLPVYWGNRNWEPYVEDAWQQMADDGIEHVYVFATSAYASASAAGSTTRTSPGPAPRPAGAPPRRSCRTTSTPRLRDGERRRAGRRARRAARRRPRHARLVATAHSIPNAMAAVAGPDGGAYEAELTAAARQVVDAVEPGRPVDLVWQSRSGPPSVPWLEPDVNDHLRALAAEGDGRRALPGRVRQRPPRGDLGPRQRGQGDRRRLGLVFARAGTAGTHPAFVATVRELVEERRAGGEPRLGTNCPALLFRPAARRGADQLFQTGAISLVYVRPKSLDSRATTGAVLRRNAWPARSSRR